MLFTTEVREDVAKWAKDNNVNPKRIVAWEGKPPRKPGFTYKPLAIPVSVPGLKFYEKVPDAPQPMPQFNKLDPDPTPEMRHPKQPTPKAAKPKPVAKSKPRVVDFGPGRGDKK